MAFRIIFDINPLIVFCLGCSLFLINSTAYTPEVEKEIKKHTKMIVMGSTEDVKTS